MPLSKPILSWCRFSRSFVNNSEWRYSYEKWNIWFMHENSQVTISDEIFAFIYGLIIFGIMLFCMYCVKTHGLYWILPSILFLWFSKWWIWRTIITVLMLSVISGLGYVLWMCVKSII